MSQRRSPTWGREGRGFAGARGLALAALLCAPLASCTTDPGSPAPGAATAAAAPAGETVPAVAARVGSTEDAAGPRQGMAERLDPERAALPCPVFAWPPTPEALAAGFDSPTEVAWMAVQAIDRNDQVRMHGLLVDERTYLEKLWPSFEAERPANTIPAQFHWDHLEMKSLGGIIDMTREHAGRGLRLRTVTYDSVANYVIFQLYRHPRVIVEDPRTGELEELRLFGDIVEIDGKHKLLSYPS